MFANFFQWILGDLFDKFFGDTIRSTALELKLLNSKLDMIGHSIKAGPLDVKLIRHKMGSIDLSDMREDQTMTESERQSYCASISAVFPRLERDIKRFMYKQLEWNVTQAENWQQTVFGRGTFNGLDLLLEQWRQAHNEHQELLKPKSFDQYKPTADLEE